MSDTDVTKKIFLLDSIIYELCNNYNYITPDKITNFASVFYPIANIELEMQERTFEDFEPVQLAVLKLMNLGYKNPKVLSKLLGLNAIYIGKIQKLLFGYQLIDDSDNVTSLGKESLKANKKIQLVNTKQIFQLDPINGTLIKLDNAIQKDRFRAKGSLPTRVAIIDYPDFIDSDIIVSNVTNDDFRSIMAQKNGILNTNVEKITSIKCLEVVYIKSYVVFLKGVEEPLIFSKREDFTKIRASERYKWLPFSVPNEKTANVLSLNSFVYTNKNNQVLINDRIRQLFEIADSEKVHDLVNSKITDIMDAYYINPDYVTYNSYDSSIRLDNKAAFKNRDIRTVNNLYKLAKDGMLITSDDSFAGKIVRIYSTNPNIISASRKLQKIVNQQGTDNENQNIKLAFKKLEKGNHTNIIDLIEEY